MKRFLVFVLSCAPALAAISGTVTNRTTGKPQAGALIALDKISTQSGMEEAGRATSDAQGNFTINQTLEGPALLRVTHEGVTYNHMVSPGSPTTGVTVDVYDVSKEPGAAKVGKHMVMLQPSAGQMGVNETFLMENNGKVAWYDAQGTVRFYLPAGAGGKAEVNATAPGGMPISAALVKTARPDVFGIDFPIKPGETRIDISYTAPYNAGAPYEGKIVTKDENTYLISPNGVTLKGDHLNDLGSEPQTKAHIYGLQAAAYKVELSGAPVAAPETAADDSGDSGAPQIVEVMPHVFGDAKLILALALGILAVGFGILYRATPGASAAKESKSNERARG